MLFLRQMLLYSVIFVCVAFCRFSLAYKTKQASVNPKGFQPQFYRGIANVIKRDCEQIINKSLKFICSGLYPNRILLRYRDGNVLQFEVYSIFQSTESDDILVSFGTKDLRKCNNIRMMSPKQIVCESESVQKEYQYAYMECLPFHYTLTDELLNHCRATERVGNFTALHYGYNIVLLSSRAGRPSSIDILACHCSIYMEIIIFILLSMMISNFHWPIF